MNNRYKYSLQKYRRPSDKHTCPACGRKQCFKYYVDENNQPLNERVGYCDHQASCGYHYTPRQYFSDNPQLKGRQDWQSWQNHIRQSNFTPRQNAVSSTPSYLDYSFVEKSKASIYTPSDLMRFLLTIYNTDTVADICDLYKVGRTRDSRTIFWQIDIENRVRTGLIMKYKLDGHRDHYARGAFNWAHSILAKQGIVKDYNLVQCLFGEHLLAEYPDRNIALVEGAKSALICAAWLPQYIWVATCGKNQFKHDVLKVLKGRNVTVFPDVDGFDKWKSIAGDVSKKIGCTSMVVSDLLQRYATPQQIEEHIDIADLVVEIRKNEYQREEKEDIFLQMLTDSKLNAFCKALELRVVSVGPIEKGNDAFSQIRRSSNI